MFDVSMIGLYVLKNVEVHFVDQSVKRGLLMQNPGNVLALDGESLALDTIEDVRYIAEVDDYHAYKGYGELGKLQFSRQDLAPDFDLSDLLYGEYSCMVSCHLCLEDMKIVAKDIRLVEKHRRLHMDCAADNRLLYRFADGTVVMGNLSREEEVLSLITPEGNRVPLVLDDVVEITKAPEENDYIYVRMTGELNVHSGIVSAVNGNMVILISSEGRPDFLDLGNASEIRFRGTVYHKKGNVKGKAINRVLVACGSTQGDDGFLCKLPYSRDPEAMKNVQDGDEVSFVAGINDRYLIARDVELLQTKKVQEVVAPREEHEYYGVIITVNLSRENGYGYVGNRYVSKACGNSEDGHARFVREQLDFNIEYNKAFVVKYSAYEDEESHLRIITSISLHKVLDITKYGIVNVSDEGEIEAVPLYKAGIVHYENRDIDVQCLDGSVHSGRLAAHDENGITVIKGRDDSGETTVIPFADIEDIRIVGTVSQFFQNGTGYVDNVYFFHINEMEQGTDAQYIRRGTQVSFSIRNARKGNHVDCGNICIVRDRKIDVYVTSYQDQSYKVVDADKYGRGICFMDYAYEVPYSMYNQFRDLASEDYHAILTIQRKHGLYECTNIKILDSCPKLRQGIVTELNREKNTVALVATKDGVEKGFAVTYDLSPQGEAGRITSTEKFDYPVLYYLQMQGGTVVAAVITWVDLKGATEKKYWGYMEQYNEEKGYGWIVPDKYLGTPFAKAQRVYCRKNAFVDAPEAAELCDTKNIFRICYTMDMESEITKYNPSHPAKRVWFLEKKERALVTGTAAPAAAKAAPASVAAKAAAEAGKSAAVAEAVKVEVQPQPEVVREPDMVLSEVYPGDGPDGADWRFGILPAYGNNFDYLKIHRSFAGAGKKKTEDSIDENQLFIVNQPVSSIRFDYADGIAEMDTYKSVYLVRFAVKDVDGLEVYDDQYPVQVLKEFQKKYVYSVSIQDGVLHAEPVRTAVKDIAENGQGEMASAAQTPAAARENVYVVGETIMARTADQKYIIGEFASVEGSMILFKDGRSVNTDEVTVIRFGVLTSFDDTMTIGYLNGFLAFPIANMEPKTFNIVKNAKRKMLLCYTTRNGAIEHIERISPELRSKMPIQWQLGKVTDYRASVEERCIWVNDNVTCYLSVETGGSIQSLAKEGNFKDTVVFIKTVNCPLSEEGKLECSAFDIHCEKENSVIRYDAVTDHFLATRSAARAETVEGNYSILQSLVDTETEVLYRVSDDGYTLQAYIDGDDSGDEWTDETIEEDMAVSKALLNKSLVRFYIEHTDLRRLELPAEMVLSETGWPVNDAQAAKLASYILGKKSVEIEGAMAVIALLEKLPEDVCREVLTEGGSSSIEGYLWFVLTRRAGFIGRNANYRCWAGEYSYFKNTILTDIHSIERQRLELYNYFLQDFHSRFEVMDILRRFKSGDRKIPRVDLKKLFKRNLIEDNAGQLLAHIISLDEASVQYLISTERVLDENASVVYKIQEWGKQIDSTQEFESIPALIDYLRSLYRNDKSRFLRELENASHKPDVIVATEGVLQIIRGRFVKLIQADDVRRFDAVQEVCHLVTDNRHAGFAKYRAALLESWAKINELVEEAEAHPTMETTEMLIHTHILEKIREEIAATLDELLARHEYMPDIRCESNGSEIIAGQKSLMLLVANGDNGYTNRQSAWNVKLHLEVMSGLASDSVPSVISLSDKELLAGMPDTILDNIPLSLESLDGDSFSIAVTAEYECSVGFAGGEVRVKQEADCGTLEFQIQTEERIVKNKEAVNYYLHPSEGKPLKENNSADNSMFFGRETEMAEIWDALVDENEDLREGRAVMLYGQKKTGKTSLANQILGRMNNTPKVKEQAIIIRIDDVLEVNGGVTGLPYFSQNFYRHILMAFKIELLKNHKDVKQLLKDNGLEIPNLSGGEMAASLFQGFFLEFAALDQGQHRVVLVMDEFTRLCTTLIDYPQYQQIPNFIKLFSGMGFVQIIIGHPNMMKALSTLGIINHTAEFSKRVELTGLKQEEAIALIREPMIRSFGYDVYDSPLGRRAINMLLDLSGCHPSVLMKLCNEMFQHFVATDYPKIIHRDVTKMLNHYLDSLDPATIFDILVTEDGDAANFFDNLPTYRYLKYVALQSMGSNNMDCDMNIVCPDLSVEQNNEIRETLIMRKVLTAGNGRIRIVTKLFLEYVRFKYKNN